jgi:hypothetical protein
MKQPTTTGKLVRDHIPDIIRQGGREPLIKQLDASEYLDELHAKLDEEVAEVHSSGVSDLPGEIADVLEVLRAIADLNAISWTTIEAVREKKLRERGAFQKRVWLQMTVQQHTEM